jgi:predicted O-methyltransferase YrrM
MTSFETYVWETVKPFTWLSQERIFNNIQCINEVVEKNIPGDILEIGVYKGGSIMSMLMALNNNGEKRHVHLYDTFEGMTAATEHDVAANGGIHYDDAVKIIPEYACIASLDMVKSNVAKIRYSPDYIHYHVGDIIKTIEFPKSIAMLRLDTDFYDSTKFELDNFYPLVSSGGIVIIDDYGHWKGSRKATDEFLADKPNIILHKIDYTGVYFYKP